jgi:hypothetical protein
MTVPRLERTEPAPRVEERPALLLGRDRARGFGRREEGPGSDRKRRTAQARRTAPSLRATTSTYRQDGWSVLLIQFCGNRCSKHFPPALSEGILHPFQLTPEMSFAPIFAEFAGH